MKLNDSQLQELESIARNAGAGILSVYESDDFYVESKGDGSPLTRADRLAHDIIVAGLTDIPLSTCSAFEPTGCPSRMCMSTSVLNSDSARGDKPSDAMYRSPKIEF